MRDGRFGEERVHVRFIADLRFVKSVEVISWVVFYQSVTLASAR